MLTLAGTIWALPQKPKTQLDDFTKHKALELCLAVNLADIEKWREREALGVAIGRPPGRD